MNFFAHLLQHVRVSVACIAFALISPIASLQAQQLRVAIPFAFENGSEHFEPGSYVVQSGNGHIVLFSGADRSASALMLPELASRQAAYSKLVFARYGERYFLREIWFSGSSRYMRLVPSKTEKQLQIALGNAAAKAPEMALLASSR